METNVWYYTLSTIAQVLAAVTGLFAVFVVWKVQESSVLLTEFRSASIRMLSYVSSNIKDYTPHTLQELFFTSDKNILVIFKKILDIKNESGLSVNESIRSNILALHYSIDENTYLFYKDLVDKKDSIIQDLKNILILNFLTIVGSVMALIFSVKVTYNTYILYLVFFFTVLCLFKIGYGIYSISKE